MIIKNILFTCCLVTLCSTITLKGQTAVKVTLNNSSSIRGEFIKIAENGDIVIKLNRRDTFIIPHTQISRYDIDGFKKNNEGTYSLFYQKYKFHTEGILLLGENIGGWGLKQTINRNLLQSLYGGLTLGIDNYTGNAELNVYSIGANLRYYIKSLPNHPFISFNSGYGAYNPRQKFNQVGGKGGMYFNPSAGFSFGNRVTFDISVGLRFQNATINYQQGEVDSEARWKYRRLALQFGATF